uniref:phospholipase A2 inhibitor subunit gamma B-like n=1 Tax=Podarcis muralis TaxID=64176 RepID=UPI00109FD052|nr:phospholipase A2 inhibitor subunit gamma B-like [Podarcis muralis]
MMKTLLISCLLLTLLNPVASLICESCWNSEGTDCRRKTEVCDESSDQSCMSVVGFGKLLYTIPMVLKSCIKTELCDANYQYSSGSIMSLIYIYSKMSCCKTDMCNSGPPEIPEHEKRENNGLKCPACLESHTDVCEYITTVSCRNEEDQCFSFGVHYTFGGADVLGALRGCGTASFCNQTDWLFQFVLERLSIAVIHAECTKAMEDDANVLVAEGRQTSTAQKNPPFMEIGGLVVEEGRSQPEDSQAFFPEV